jgi:hypothetical protein
MIETAAAQQQVPQWWCSCTSPAACAQCWSAVADPVAGAGSNAPQLQADANPCSGMINASSSASFIVRVRSGLMARQNISQAGKNARELCPTGATLPAQAHIRRGFYMRALQILGAILILGGLFVLIKSPSYSSDKSLLKIGDVEAKVSQEHAIPPWVGGAGVVAGVILIVVGARKP